MNTPHLHIFSICIREEISNCSASARTSADLNNEPIRIGCKVVDQLNRGELLEPKKPFHVVVLIIWTLKRRLGFFDGRLQFNAVFTVRGRLGRANPEADVMGEGPREVVVDGGRDKLPGDGHMGVSSASGPGGEEVRLQTVSIAAGNHVEKLFNILTSGHGSIHKLNRDNNGHKGTNISMELLCILYFLPGCDRGLKALFKN